MLVSVIIPNYNHDRFLFERIDSVLSQTYNDFEVIILDDSSTDTSKSLINNFVDHPRISHIIFNESNSGSLFKQWEKGIKLSKGEVIWIAESDDYAHPDFLTILVPILSKNNDLGLVYCNSKIIDEKNICSSETYADIRNSILNTDKWNSSYYSEGLVEISNNLLAMCTINNASAVVFKKQVLEEVNPFDKEFKYVGDWYCYLKICSRYSIYYVNEPLNYYRRHSQNASIGLTKSIKFIEEHFKLFDWVFKNLPTINKDQKEAIFGVYIKHRILKNLNTSNIKSYLSLFKLNPRLFLKMIYLNI